jgi:hypothetical protein
MSGFLLTGMGHSVGECLWAKRWSNQRHRTLQMSLHVNPPQAGTSKEAANRTAGRELRVNGECH